MDGPQAKSHHASDTIHLTRQLRGDFPSDHRPVSMGLLRHFLPGPCRLDSSRLRQEIISLRQLATQLDAGRGTTCRPQNQSLNMPWSKFSHASPITMQRVLIFLEKSARQNVRGFGSSSLLQIPRSFESGTFLLRR